MSETRTSRTCERCTYVLQIGDTRYSTGSYRRISEFYDAIKAYADAVQEFGSTVPVVIQVERR